MNFVSVISAFLSGVLGSMGLGGGTILVVYLTRYMNFPQLASQGINLLCFIPTAFISTVIYCKNKLIDKRTVLPLALFGIIGSAIGFLCLSWLSEEILQRLFGTFLVVLGLKELFSKSRNE
ncbi:MAG: sulfite exporter TauE/SafE family protein [Clostridia bacterium]|nr:sulfite exporter TauE/SafE family protein [Clostridia bacterium]MBQ5906197.1 sulfite exporter TauE/SafE family protein [Clostridia bacterium]